MSCSPVLDCTGSFGSLHWGSATNVSVILVAGNKLPFQSSKSSPVGIMGTRKILGVNNVWIG